MDEKRRMGREAVGGERKPATDLSLLADFPAQPGPPLTRSSFSMATDARAVPDPGQLCVMCGHGHAVHAVGTDGAGWCGGEERCDCNGFQA